MKKFFSIYLFTLIFTFFFVGLGSIFIIFRNRELATTYFSFISVIIILTGLAKLVLLDKNRLVRLEYNLDLAEGILDLIIGVVFLNFHQYFVLDLILFVGYITVPICRCFYAKHPSTQLFVDLPKFILSISIVFASNYTFKAFFTIMGIIFIMIGIGILIRKIINEIKEKRSISEKKVEQ